mgnify:FL=1|jgi:co-chaperonin GroES (HSP10)
MLEKMRAVNKYIIIKPTKKEPLKKNGLLLTEKFQEEIRYKEATVEAVGNYVEGVKKGDQIYYDKHAGYGIEYEDSLLQVIKEQDVVVVL